MSSDNYKPVYSCQSGPLCPDCGKASNHCNCQRQKGCPKGDGIVRLQRETKGRKGKGVTLITGVPLTGVELKKLAKVLKQKCGTGGTIRDGVIEIQGDHRDLLLAELQKKGWTVKKAGG
jgi:translation initiation factor 1